MTYSGIFARLLWRGITHRCQRSLAGGAPRPRSITITITRKCNSRCIMCNIWRLAEKRDELSLEHIINFLSHHRFSRLVELDLTGGEPFLRKDFPELMAKIAGLKEKRLPKLRTLALASNGLMPKLVARRVRRMLSSIAGKFDVALVCSLDGIGERHDAIRGIPGAYEKTMETVRQLQELGCQSYPFWLGVKTTILPMNWDQIPAIRQFAKENGLFHIVSPVLFAEDRFRNLNRSDELSLLPRFREELLRFYGGREYRDSFYASVIIRMLRANRRKMGCTAAMDHFFVEGDGRILPCPMVSLALGNIKTQTLDEILVSKTRAAFASQAGRHSACRLCSEPGCIRFSQTGEAFTFLRFLLGQRGTVRLHQALYEEGLMKYFI